MPNAGSETRQGLPSGHGEIGRSRRVRHVCTCGSGWTRIPKWGWKLPPSGPYPWNILAEREVRVEASPRTAANFAAPAKGELGPPPWLSVSVGSGRLVCNATVISQLGRLTDMQQGSQDGNDFVATVQADIDRGNRLPVQSLLSRKRDSLRLFRLEDDLVFFRKPLCF